METLAFFAYLLYWGGWIIVAILILAFIYETILAISLHEALEWPYYAFLAGVGMILFGGLFLRLFG